MDAVRQLAERYDVGEVLGAGAVTEVFRGRDTRLDRPVAIKFLRHELAADAAACELFRREVLHAAALNHPAVVAVYDSGTAETGGGTVPYVVTEYVEGVTLRARLAEGGPLQPQQALKIIADVCVALDVAHRTDMTHGRLTPGNVMLTTAGAVKVTDIGHGKVAHRNAAGDEPGGTHADVRGIGMLLYELLTGHPPHGTHSTHPHLAGRRTPAPPSAWNPALPHELDAVTLTALDIHPDSGYASALAVRADVLRVLAGRPPAALTAPAAMADTGTTEATGTADASDATDEEWRERGRRRNRMLLVLAAVAVAAGAFALWLGGFFDRGVRVATVPPVVGQEYHSAERSLRDAGFHDFQRGSVPCWAQAYGEAPPCSPDDAGTVVDIQPEQGSSHPVSTPIHLEVGRPPQTLAMPDLTGMSVDEAEEIIDEHDLLLEPATDEVDNNDPERAGQVAGHTPDPRTNTEQGAVVTLQVYGEPEMIEVPDYVGHTYALARTGLEAAGFEVLRTDVESDEPENAVVGQSPRSGEAVRGSEVTLRVSTGPDEEAFTMPDVVGMTESEARSALDGTAHTGDVSIRRRTVTDREEHGRVTATLPRAGRDIDADDPVTLYLGEYRSADDDGEPTPTGTTGEDASGTRDTDQQEEEDDQDGQEGAEPGNADAQQDASDNSSDGSREPPGDSGGA
ncbi:PASTA domain-containing protein [Haloechinothrix sp. LS1_15]|uniref:PASTA domain-containing protein n=1 Tax=Haloechinothrix sp. LS1_15 TaxID=2652248 RepID=UPI00294ADEA7|nr:PASTA domain-containing protein [Haloechinothrix sp. LS1_15]